MNVRFRTSLPLLLVAAALTPSCGDSETEVRRAEKRAEVKELRVELADATSKNQELTVTASDAVRRLDDARAEAEAARSAEAAAKAETAEKVETALEESKQKLDSVERHRDELTEWIEQDLLPIAEKEVPELANLKAATETMGAEVAAIRGLDWKTPVMRRRIRRAQVGEWMRRDLKKDLPEDKAREMVLVGAEMGLVAPGTDVYEIFSEFLEAGAAAFYKPDTRTFYHIEGNDGRGAYPVVFHELVHAIEDQHFDLQAFYEGLDGDTDKSLARRGLVEGSASYFQDLYQAKHPADVTEMMKSQMTPDMMKRQQRMLQVVPPFLVAQMGLYPYQNGKRWVELMCGGDRAKVAALYADPPVSTEQVLHPEKFSNPQERDYPHTIAVPSLDSLPANWNRLDSDTMGELSMGCLLAQLRFPGPIAFLNLMDMKTQGVGFKGAIKTAVEGWDGDRYAAAIDPKTGRATILWVTVWDSEQDAQEFVSAYAPMLAKKVTGASGAGDAAPLHFVEMGSDRVSAIETAGTRVVIVLGSPPSELDALIAAGRATTVTADPRDPD